MALKFTCSLCAKEVVTQHLKIGEKFPCPHCKGKVLVPANAETTESGPPSENDPSITTEGILIHPAEQLASQAMKRLLTPKRKWWQFWVRECRECGGGYKKYTESDTDICLPCFVRSAYEVGVIGPYDPKTPVRYRVLLQGMLSLGMILERGRDDSVAKEELPTGGSAYGQPVNTLKAATRRTDLSRNYPKAHSREPDPSIWTRIFGSMGGGANARQEHTCVAMHCRRCGQDHCSCVTCRQAQGIDPILGRTENSQATTAGQKVDDEAGRLVDDYKRALAFLESRRRFAYQDYTTSIRMAGIKMTEAEMQQQWSLAKETIYGSESLRQIQMDVLREGISVFEHVRGISHS
jgi:DNA-directed RNA polymerase subunit RPC12/RpoP